MNRFSDQGIVLSIKKYNENSLLVKILSQKYGICSGFVRGFASNSKKSSLKSSAYQNFNLIDFEWSSKIADNLGFFKAELKQSFLGEIIADRLKLLALTSIGTIIEQNILERENVIEIFSGLLNLLQNLAVSNKVFLQKYIKLEIELLKILGYGLDLSCCVVTGLTENLRFVSPKSGKAVCSSAGEKYRDKLLPLPQFLIDKQLLEISHNDLLDGLKLSGLFIEKYLEFQGSKDFVGKNFQAIFNSRKFLVEMVNKNNL